MTQDHGCAVLGPDVAQGYLDLFPAFRVERGFLGISVAWFLFFVVGTTYVFHKARQAGEWPPPDRRDS